MFKTYVFFILLYIFFNFTIIAALNATPALSEFYTILQKDFCMFIFVFKEKIAADLLNHGFTRLVFYGIYLNAENTDFKAPLRFDNSLRIYFIKY